MTAVLWKEVGGVTSRGKTRSQRFVCCVVSCLVFLSFNWILVVQASPASEVNNSSLLVLPVNNSLVMPQTAKVPRLSPGDPNSYSRPDLVSVSDIHLNLSVDFTAHTLKGFADLTVQKHSDTSELILDSRDLVIKAIKLLPSGEKLTYTISEPIDSFGSKFTVNLPSNFTSGSLIRICYETSPNCPGLQWLSPNQTAGKEHPYLFSQCEMIFARGMLPCQDTPSIKTKYTAEITAPSPLTVLMSALRDGEPSPTVNGVKTHRFKQPVPVPAYLFAIAVGALEWREIGPRSRVWSEKEFVEKAAYEFAETESFLKIAEQLCGPYVWGIYDILVLPPSFPFGGMENPCLTFVTPTLLAGDRSLANVVAHEISHSWTGNLVTNANFEHFWLNEGWTVFTERKIKGRLQGEKARQFDAIGGLKELEETVNNMNDTNPLTALVPDLQGVDPEDVYSNVPYEKGHTFLFYLEQLLGGPSAFEPFLQSYISTFKFKSITSDQFKKFLEESFPNKTEELKSVDWNAWFYKPGMPPVIPAYDETLSKACKALAERWQKWVETEAPCFPISEWKALNVDQQIEVLALLLIGPDLSVKKVRTLGEAYNLGKSNNCEIRLRWLRICIKAKWEDQIDAALQFVTEQGRMKYLRPIYRDLYKWEAARQRAIDTFQRNKPYMMSMSANAVAKELHL